MGRRLKFIWGSSNVIRGRWHFGLVGLYERRTWPVDGMAISVRGLLLWLVSVAVPGYLAAAAGLFWIWHFNPYSALTYSDALYYPFRRAEITGKKGQAFIEQGKDLFRAGKYHESIRLLRFGLKYYPQDFRARLLLAQFYLMTNQRPIALDVINEGLTESFPGRPYLERLFTLSAEGEDYGRIAQLCTRYLPRLGTEVNLGTRLWLIERRFDALFAAERWQEALAFAESEASGNGAIERRIRALLALERSTEALALLAAWPAPDGSLRTVATELKIRALRQANRLGEMEQVIAELRVAARGDPAALVFAVVQQALAGQASAAAAALDDYIFRFGGAPENLQRVAGSLAEIGNLPLLVKTVAAADDRGFPTDHFHLLLGQTHVRRGEWEAAARALGSVSWQPGFGANDRAVEREWMTRLLAALCHRSPVHSRELVDFLARRPWRITIFHQSIEALMQAEQFDTAQAALDVAWHLFPSSARLAKDASMLSAKPAVAHAE